MYLFVFLKRKIEPVEPKRHLWFEWECGETFNRRLKLLQHDMVARERQDAASEKNIFRGTPKLLIEKRQKIRLTTVFDTSATQEGQSRNRITGLQITPSDNTVMNLNTLPMLQTFWTIKT